MCYQTHIRVHRAQPKDLFTLKYFFKFKQLFFFVYNEFLRVSRLNHKFFLERKRFEFDKKKRWCRFVHQPMYLGNLEIIRAAILTWFTIRQPVNVVKPVRVWQTGRVPFRTSFPGEGRRSPRGGGGSRQGRRHVRCNSHLWFSPHFPEDNSARPSD